MPSKRTAPTKHNVEAKSTRASGCALAVVCYGFMAFLLSLTPARFLWWMLVVLVLPILIGAVAVKGTSHIDTPVERFRKGFWTCGIPMFVYVAISLMLAHHKVGPSGSAGGEFFAGLIAACLYTLLAGIVAGVTGMMLYRQAGRQGEEA